MVCVADRPFHRTHTQTHPRTHTHRNTDMGCHVPEYLHADISVVVQLVVQSLSAYPSQRRKESERESMEGRRQSPAVGKRRD